MAGETQITTRPGELARFRVKFDKNGPTPDQTNVTGQCWQWVAGRTKQGYGLFHPTKKRQVLAHRYAWETTNGPIPDGLVIDHLCRNRRCVNPGHMEPVTNEENLRRGAGYALRNGMRTACKNGHPYTPETTYVNPKGKRFCQPCARARDQQPKRSSTYRRQIKTQREREQA